jgi:hypothetical protein
MDEDPMEFLNKQRAMLAGMAEMAAVAQAQEAVAMNVQRRMAKIDALLAEPSSSSSSIYTSTTSNSSYTPSTSSYSNASAQSTSSSTSPTANMSADEEVQYWKNKIAILSQPVTANGLAPPGTVPYPSTTSTSTTSYEQPAQPQQRQQRQQRQQQQQPAQSTYQQQQQAARQKQQLQAERQERHHQQQQQTNSFGHKVNASNSTSSASPSPQRNRNQMSQSPAGNFRPRQKQQSQSPHPASPASQRSRRHHGEPVANEPEGFPPTPPGWKRARDKKSGRYYLYRGSETTWETDRNGRRYKK